MGAIIVAAPLAGPSAESRRSTVLHILLGLGWAGLFAYCGAYLDTDLPLQTSSVQSVGEPLIAQLDDLSRPVMALAAPEPAGAVAAPDAGAPLASPIIATQPVAPPATPRSASAGFAYVGTWGPTPDACSAPARRKGYVPATFTSDRAQAGDTICSFRGAHRTGNAWAMAADCGARDRRWSSQVRIAVNGDRLTWTSAMGTSTYVRCARRAG